MMEAWKPADFYSSVEREKAELAEEQTRSRLRQIPEENGPTCFSTTDSSREVPKVRPGHQRSVQVTKGQPRSPVITET